MNTSKKIAKVVKITTTAAAGTAVNAVKGLAIAAPVAFVATTAVNKICNGAWDVKGAAISVAKNSVFAVATVTAVNAALAATTATIAAVNNESIFADEDPSVEEFDDWDEDEEEE
jgi:drug/metabolite transporter superfamily protein YnfA